MAKVHAHFAALPVSKGLQPDLELWTGEQLNTFVAAAQFKRALKKIVTVEDGCLYTYRTPQQQDRIDAIIANFQAKGKTVLNRVPFDEALKLFRATAAEE